MKEARGTVYGMLHMYKTIGPPALTKRLKSFCATSCIALDPLDTGATFVQGTRL